MSRYEIYNHKKGVEGASPLNAESPVNEIATDERKKQKFSTMLRYGDMLAQRAYSSITQEVRLNGNETLATTLNNITRVGSSITMAMSSKGLSLIPEAINASADLISVTRQNARENRLSNYQREIEGSRINFNQGRIYYD